MRVRSGRWAVGSRLRVAVAGAVLVGTMAACGDDGPSEVSGAPAEPRAGTFTTWVLASGADVAVPAPPQGAPTQADVERVRQEASSRTPEVLEAIEKWSAPLAVEPWMQVVFDLVARSEKNPPLSSRNYALVSIAMNDAIVSSYYWKYRYNVDPPSGVDRAVPASADPSYPSEHAAMAGAASRVIAHLYPNESALRLDEMADNAAWTRVQAGTNTPTDVEAGLALGREVAEKVIAYAKTDRSDAVWDGRRPAGIGRGPAFWEPPPGSVANPAAPLGGTWKTFVLRSPSQFPSPPPPAYNSAEFRASAQKLIDIKNNLTPEQAAIAKFWEGAEGTPLPAGIVNEVYFEDLREAATAGEPSQRATLPWLARAVALLNVAMSDGGIAVWAEKYQYWYPRPENGIRDIGLDRSWTPHLPTPFFPAYPSGSAGYAGAAEAVMAHLFPSKAAEFNRRAEEQALSRQYAGIHWDFDAVSIDGGRLVGKAVVDRAMGDGAGTRP
ncbi:MAG: hypothetical protein AB1673_08875 [Actinomycetota bacterium]